eukprot:g2196.t1
MKSILFFLLAVLPVSILGNESFKSFSKVGVLSQGNFETVHHLLHKDASMVLAKSTTELYELVENGTVDAGLISGMPDKSRFDVHPSGSISPRAMFTRIGDTKTRQQIDAAIVRLIMEGKLSEYATNNPPFEFVEVNTCRATSESKSNFPFLSVQQAPATITVGAIGPYDWHQDGNYKVDPPTGFWPDYFRGLEAKLKPQGTVLVRKYFSTSQEVMEALENNTIDVTEPYWTVDSFYKNRARSWTFDAGCTTLGYESSFFTPKIDLLSTRNNDEGTDGTLVGVLVAISVLFVGTVVFVVYMVKKEQKGGT